MPSMIRHEMDDWMVELLMRVDVNVYCVSESMERGVGE